MKKILKSFAIIALSIYVLTSCSINPWFTVGLDVDTTPPMLTIDSHSDFDYVKGTFVLFGTCTDNVDITKVELSIVSHDGTYHASELKALLRQNRWQYSVISDGDTVMPDGEYTITVQAFDVQENASTSSIKSVTLYLDNSPSKVEISYPQMRSSVLAWDNTSEIYMPELSDYYMNDTFFIQGNIEETFAVETLSLRLTEVTNNNEETGKYLDVSIDSTLNIIKGGNIDTNILDVVKDKKPLTIWSWKIWFKEEASGDDIILPRYYKLSSSITDAAGNETKTSSHGYICVLPQTDYP